MIAARAGPCRRAGPTIAPCPRSASQSDFKPSGDQPEAIAQLTESVNAGDPYVTLLGATGTGKTFTVAHVVEAVQRPTLVIAPNKSLGAQLANEFREVFPDNAVEYFVSYYDYYQPEAYIPTTDTYIEKDSSINDEIERLRHAATAALLTRRDVLIVASVSCIYGLGSPEEYQGQILRPYKGTEIPLEFAMQRLVDIQYQRNQVSRARGTFRVTGDTLEVFPPYEQIGTRIEWWGDTVERVSQFDPLTGEIVGELTEITIFPASHYVASDDRMKRALVTIEEELHERLAELNEQGKLLEAERLRMRTSYDLEMMREVGFCSGIENYSRHIDGRGPGTAPYTLLDYFPDDYLVVIDESHVTVPAAARHVRGRPVAQVHPGRARVPPARAPSTTGRCGSTSSPSACNQVVFMSATPGPYELRVTNRIVEQIVRPDRPGRSRGPDPPDEGPGRRPDQRDPRPRREGPAGPGHHAHEEDGGGPDRLPGRDGHPRALPALRGRHAAADRDPARPAPGRVRRAGRHQPAARRASTSPRSRSSRSWTPTRRGSCARRRR